MWCKVSTNIKILLIYGTDNILVSLQLDVFKSKSCTSVLHTQWETADTQPHQYFCYG